MAWISTLEASYILFRLRPHHANFRKRLVQASRFYRICPKAECGLRSGNKFDVLTFMVKMI